MQDERFNEHENENSGQGTPPEQGGHPLGGGYPAGYSGGQAAGPGRQDYRNGQPGYTGYQSYQSGFHQEGEPEPQQGPAPGQQEEYRFHFEEYNTLDHNRRPQKKARTGVVVFGVLFSVIVALGLVSLASYGAYMIFSEESAEPSQSAEVNTPDNLVPELSIVDRPEGQASTVADGCLTTVEIASQVKPSVVGVAVYSGVGTFQASSEGSGVIMSEEGYIVTNAHVVEGAMGIEVTLNNGETYPADLIGIDTKTDLAVIKIEADNLIAAQFGNSDQLADGEDVVAIGNPGGSMLAGSVTKGVVSSSQRYLQESDGGYTTHYIQTDAAINPGNSGGALVNSYGQVVGINSSKIVASGYEGIGFAIPINEAKPIIDDLIRYGYVTGRVKLGISGIAITEMLGRINNLPTGIYIESVESDSDLAGRGLMRGDIITHINGTDVTSFDDVSKILSEFEPGDTVRLTIYRSSGVSAGKSFDLQARLLEDIEYNETLQNFGDLPNS